MPESTLHEVEQFLYREARLLDERRFDEWLALLDADVHYWMAARGNRYPRSSRAINIVDEARYRDDDLPAHDEIAIIDDDRKTLERRVARLATGYAWAEDPPSRTRHLITNIELDPTEDPNALRVHSNFLVYRTRAETEQDFYVGARSDVLRRVGDGTLRIARRRIVLDQNVILAKNISNFF